MPTALALTREEWEPYIEAALRRPDPPGLSLDERRERERLLVRVREAAAVLKTRFGARRVVLFGSLAHAAWFTPNSDVDLAVEGLSSKDYWRAWRVVEECLGDRLVDLIDLEIVSESLRRVVEHHGVEL